MIEIITATEEQLKESDPAKAAPADAKPEAPAAQPTPVLIVFGRDKDGKPHGSWFAEPDAALATKAAGVMGMRTLPLDTEAHLALAAELPKGRVFASGRAFVPFVKKGLYERLSALAGPAKATAPEAGETAAQGPATATGEAAEQTVEAAAIDGPRYPRSWADIAVGSIVLIWGGADDGWYEADVLEAKGAGLFTLCWHDWPELPQLVRRREQMALLHPNTDAVNAA